MVTGFQQCGIHFHSLHDGFDISSSGGKLFFHILGALAEFERNLISERTIAGLQAAKARGRKGGRRPRMTPEQVSEARGLHTNGNRLHVQKQTALENVRSNLDILEKLKSQGISGDAIKEIEKAVKGLIDKHGL